MKKVLLSLLLFGVLFSCGKKEENSTENTAKSGAVSTESKSSTPKFKDPDVQKLAEAYAELLKEYDNMTPEKAGTYLRSFRSYHLKARK